MTNPVASPYTRPIQIGSATLGGGLPLVLIARTAFNSGARGTGGCFTLAARLSAESRALDVPLIFRIAMPPLANGLATGFDEALSVLAEIRDRLGVPVAIDVREPQQIAEAAKVVDLLQIPAALCRQTDLVIEAARTGRPVNIEKDSLLPPGEAVSLLDEVASVGNWNVMLTECGTGNDKKVVDGRALTTMRESGFPIVFDAGATGPAEAAVAAGVDGVAVMVADDKAASASPAAGYSLANLVTLLRRLKDVERD